MPALIRKPFSLCTLLAMGVASVCAGQDRSSPTVGSKPAATKSKQQPASKPQASAAASRPTTAKKPKVTPEQLRAIIQERLARNPYYSPGSLISHRDVEPIFNYLLEKGVTIATDHEELYDTILPENAHLVKLLKNPDGRVFMKKIGNDAAAYERLERLSWTFDGRVAIQRMIASKDGVAQLQKLQTPEQVAKISKQVAADPRTADFQLPTGHIHTADELLERLEGVLANQP